MTENAKTLKKKKKKIPQSTLMSMQKIWYILTDRAYALNSKSNF